MELCTLWLHYSEVAQPLHDLPQYFPVSCQIRCALNLDCVEASFRLELQLWSFPVGFQFQREADDIHFRSFQRSKMFQKSERTIRSKQLWFQSFDHGQWPTVATSLSGGPALWLCSDQRWQLSRRARLQARDPLIPGGRLFHIARCWRHLRECAIDEDSKEFQGLYMALCLWNKRETAEFQEPRAEMSARISCLKLISRELKQIEEKVTRSQWIESPQSSWYWTFCSISFTESNNIWQSNMPRGNLGYFGILFPKSNRLSWHQFVASPSWHQGLSPGPRPLECE